DACGGNAVVSGRQAWRVRGEIIAAPFGNVHDLDGDGAFGTGRDAGRGHVIAQPVVAHVTFADHAAFGIVLRDAVRTVPRAVLAADAGFRAVNHNAGDGIFRVSLYRAADHAGRLNAVVAAHREIVALRVGVVAAFDLADAPPVEVRRIAVLFVAGYDTAFAANALRHVEVKAILFALFEWTRGDQFAGRSFDLDKALNSVTGIARRGRGIEQRAIHQRQRCHGRAPFGHT